MDKKIFLLILFSIITYSAFAVDKDSLRVRNKNAGMSLNTKMIRTFSSLSKYDRLGESSSKELFTQRGYVFNTPDSTANKKWLDMATNTFNIIEKTNNYIDVLTKDRLSQLPVAITPVEISNIKYTVGIAKATFKPAYTELTVFLKVQLPDDAKRGEQILILGATDVKLSHTGGIIGNAKLNLISQFTVNYNSGRILLTLKGSFEKPGTYAIIDCSGFKKLGLDANIKFADGLLHPVDEKGKKKRGYVEANFKTTIADWNDMVVNISLPEFGVKGVEGTTFKLNTAVFDFSDLRNDEAIPQSYINKYYAGTPNLWRGVYVKSLEVILPPEFEKKGKENNRISFGAHNLIIDGQGITGKFEANNLITLKEGSASGWDISLDHFMLDIETNSLRGAGFNGKIRLPACKLDSLGYKAVFQPGEYSLQVRSLKEKVEFDVWKAKVSLKKESYVELKVKNDKFLPKANLTGDIDITSGLSDKSSSSSVINFKGIEFQELVLQTESPNLSVRYFGMKGQLKLANFPVSLNKLAVEVPSDNSARLIFGIDINLSRESDGGNGGGTTLVVKGKKENRGSSWEFDGVELKHIDIRMEIAGNKLQGAIFIFEDDSTYGTGFAGAVRANFSKIDADLRVKAIFGRTKTFRYWFADGHMTLPNGIPLFAGFAINGFGGGLYNRMKMAGYNPNADATFNEIGVSSSGVVYEPYEGNSFGFKASVGFIYAGSDDVLNGSIEFGMAFRKSGGIQEMYLKGDAKILQSLPTNFQNLILDNLKEAVVNRKEDEVVNRYLPAKPQSGAITAGLFIGYDFVNDSFHCTAEVYFNLLGVIKGVGPYGRAGWLDIYSGRDTWHFLIGVPKDPVGIKIDLVILEFALRGYFMTGKNLPGSPPPPPEVADILGIDVAQLNYTKDLNQLESGTGLGFGANFSINTGDLTFLIFYAKFQAGIGFDAMFKDYRDAHCKGSSEPIGINGWYANGQAYAYMQGELGLTFKLFGSKNKIPIISGGAATIMQGRLPNPTWLGGYLGGKFNLLGGLIKGRFRFKIDIGKKCEIIGGSPLNGIVVIGDLKPKENTSDIDVFAVPQVSFNLQINKIFELPDETGDRKYKIILDEFSIKDKGKPIEGEIKWNDRNDLASFYSHEILPPNSKLKAFIQVHFEEFKNGQWVVIKEKGKTAIETKETNFVTGTAPKTIPLTNIEFMYPVLGQKNFFKDEYKTAYINLKRGQSYLFNQDPTWKKTMSMTSSTGVLDKAAYTYNASKKQIVYTLPENMLNKTAYNVEIKMTSAPKNVVSNTEDVYKDKKISKNSSDNTLQVKSKKLKGQASKGGEKKLLEYNFRTSEYDSFREKMNAMKRNNDLYDHVDYPYGLTLLTKIDTQEPFDLLELRGNEYSGYKPLIQVMATMDDSYYKQQIYPLLYKNYPLAGEIAVRRETDKVGIPPVEGVEPMTWYITYLENGYTGETSLYNPYRYNLTHYYLKDYEDLSYQLVNSNLEWRSNPMFIDLVTKAFPYMRKGKYKTEFRYILPGQVQKGKNNIIKYINPINE